MSGGWVVAHRRRVMRRSKTEKAVTHAKIVSVAAKRFRERGLQGIGVADVMKEAGSSVGGFYKHFKSRDELAVEALAEAFKDLDRWEQNAKDLPDLLRFYLGEEHCDHPEAGCAITALAGDIRYASKAVRTVYTERVKHSLAYTADRMEGGDPASRRARAIISLGAGIGGLSLARAVNDRALSHEILAALREQLIALTRSTMRESPSASALSQS
jgi:TetR/AcrR family transcriptional regulator, transcriptional repressor for nem operon